MQEMPSCHSPAFKYLTPQIVTKKDSFSIFKHLDKNMTTQHCQLALIRESPYFVKISCYIFSSDDVIM